MGTTPTKIVSVQIRLDFRCPVDLCDKWVVGQVGDLIYNNHAWANLLRDAVYPGIEIWRDVSLLSSVGEKETGKTWEKWEEEVEEQEGQ